MRSEDGIKPAHTYVWETLDWHRGHVETLFVALDKWGDVGARKGRRARARVLVIHTTYAYHKVGDVIELRRNDNMWIGAKRIT